MGPLENFSKLLGSARTLCRRDRRVALYTRLDDVQIGKVESVQLLCEICEQSGRIAIVHVVPRAGGRDAHSDPRYLLHLRLSGL